MIIRSSKATLAFSNTLKLEHLNMFIDEYRKVLIQFIDILWEQNDIPGFLSKEITSNIQTWLTERVKQCAGKQASGIVRGCRTKQEKRKWKINELIRKGYFKKAKKLQETYDLNTVSKPDIKQVEPELDSRLIKIDLNNSTSFDGWVTISSIGNKWKIEVPFKKHKHFNKMLNKGELKKGIRLSKKNLTFMFEITPKTITAGIVLGVDSGQNTTFACSNGQMIDKDKHGYNYRSICERLARKKKDSNGFDRVVKHRTNYINWSINQLNLVNIKIVNREDIKHLRKGVKTSRVMTHWNYHELMCRLDDKLEEAGVQINKLNPTYTSQRCSNCGWVRKGNRKKKKFKCDKCSFEQDADLNASTNLTLQLKPIGRQQRLKQDNKKGFYWFVERQEPIVPVAKQS